MNTIYMYAMIVAYLLFNAVKRAYARKLSFVKSMMRTKNFILHFITLPAKWIKTGRRWVFIQPKPIASYGIHSQRFMGDKI